MFYFSNDELYSILDVNATGNISYINAVTRKAYKDYKPRFFTPYKSASEFAREFVAPVVDPVSLCGMAGGAVLGGVVATAVCLGSFLVAGVAQLFMQTGVRDSAVNFALQAMSMIGSALISAAAFLLLAVMSIPHSLASLVTRSATTIAAAVSAPAGGAKSESISDETELELVSPAMGCSI